MINTSWQKMAEFELTSSNNYIWHGDGV